MPSDADRETLIVDGREIAVSNPRKILFPGALERDHRVVGGVRPRLLIEVPCLELVVPVLDAGRLGGEELVVVNRTPPGPDAARSAEIGDAARRRNAGPGEDEHAPRAPQRVHQPRIDHDRLSSITRFASVS